MSGCEEMHLEYTETLQHNSNIESCLEQTVQ